MIERPSSGRARIRPDLNALRIEIPAKKNWFVLLFLMVWMGGWVMGESFALVSVFGSNTPLEISAFLLIWLVGWTIGGAFAFYKILWLLMGMEIILLKNRILTIEQSVRGIGRKKQYDLQLIKNLALNAEPEGEHWGLKTYRSSYKARGGKLKFDYGLKTIKFADEIDEAEARFLLEKIKTTADIE